VIASAGEIFPNWGNFEAFEVQYNLLFPRFPGAGQGGNESFGNFSWDFGIFGGGGEPGGKGKNRVILKFC